MACRPAPRHARMTTRAAFTVPAAVINIGKSAGTCPPRSSRPCSRRCWPGWTARPCSGRAWVARERFVSPAASASGPGGQRVEHADQGRARLLACTFIRRWAADLEDQLAAQSCSLVHDLAADGLVGRIRAARRQPGATPTRNTWPWALSFLAVSGVTATRSLSGLALARGRQSA